MKRIFIGVRRAAGITLACLFAFGCAAPALAYTQEEQTELQIGQQEYQRLAQKGEIIQSSPYYNILNPIAKRIKSVADRQYFVPFRFLLVNESDPNAFAVPGGNVYVTTAMMKFVRNKEELAGVLCHETSHDIHHDVYNLLVKDQQLSLYAGIASLLFGHGNNAIANGIINIAANLDSLHFSREVEQNADHKGAITCAQAGFTPWGLLWLLDAFQSADMPNPPEILSDHPSNVARIQALKEEFAGNPSLFARFNSDISKATPINARGFHNQYRTAYVPGRNAYAAACLPGFRFC